MEEKKRKEKEGEKEEVFLLFSFSPLSFHRIFPPNLKRENIYMENIFTYFDLWVQSVIIFKNAFDFFISNVIF